MAEISIDRMSVSLSSMSSGDSERLARLIAEKLVAASSSVAASGRHESVNVNLPGANGLGVDRLAEQIVDELVRQLNRTV